MVNLRKKYLNIISNETKYEDKREFQRETRRLRP